MLPLALAGLALLLMGSGKSSTAPKRAAPPRKVLVPGNVVVKVKPAQTPKSAPKTVNMTPRPVAPPKPAKPKVATTRMATAPLASNPSQGSGPGLNAPLSADIPTDTMRTVPFVSMPAASRPASTSRSQLPGYKPDAARRAASSIANHLKRSGKAKYDRRMLKQWQTHAGLPADGIYGPATRGALVYFGQKDPPAPFLGTGTIAYKP